MSMIGSLLRTSLRGLRVIPTRPLLRVSPHTSLHHARVKQFALVVSRTNSTAPSSSKLVVSGRLNKFPLSFSNFQEIREFPGLAYFDKTGYIPVVERGPKVQLVCRPRRFGKSLTISMLQSFHGVEFRNQYDQVFKGLDVDRAVKNGEVTAGQYLVLKFDFSRVDRSPDVHQAAAALRRNMNLSLLSFANQYRRHLGESFAAHTSRFFDDNDPPGNLAHYVEATHTALREIHEAGDKSHPLFGVKGIYMLADEYDAIANEYMDPHDINSWTGTELASLIKGFWATVKGSKADYYGIKRVFITGVAPLLLSDLTSGFNEQQNYSFASKFSAMYGLTQSDVLGALKLICNNEEEVQKHFSELAFHANGYYFCQKGTKESVFNTYTALSYFQAVKEQEIPDIEDPENSEVSEPFLKICAGAPAAVQDMQFALQKDEHGQHQRIPYDKVLRGFKLTELSTQAAGEGDISAWRSLMVYMGGLTFDSHDPFNSLVIPNRVAARRFGHALLSRIGLYRSMKSALHFLSKNGNIKEVLTGYRHLMQERDVGYHAFQKTEEDHRDSIRHAILENPALTPHAEYRVTKSDSKGGLVDLLIECKEFYIVLEFKNVQIDFLGLKAIDRKAEQLMAMNLDEILKLRFKNCKFRKGTIRNWVDKDVRQQLRSYITGDTVQEEIAGKKFRAFAIVIIGSRQILMHEMDRNGDWVGKYELA